MGAGKPLGDLGGAPGGLLGADFIYIDDFDNIPMTEGAISPDHPWLRTHKVTGIFRQRHLRI